MRIQIIKWSFLKNFQTFRFVSCISLCRTIVPLWIVVPLYHWTIEYINSSHLVRHGFLLQFRFSYTWIYIENCMLKIYGTRNFYVKVTFENEWNFFAFWFLMFCFYKRKVIIKLSRKNQPIKLIDFFLVILLGATWQENDGK